jgi:predicted DNA-binding transcriptional regulator AlpA
MLNMRTHCDHLYDKLILASATNLAVSQQLSAIQQQHRLQGAPMNKRLLQEADAARYIGMSRSFLRKSRMDGNRRNHTPAPPYVRVTTRAVRYDIQDLDAWISINKVHLNLQENN